MMKMMKLTIPMLIATAMLTGGCTDRIKELEAENRALSARLETVSGERGIAYSERDRLRMENQAKERELAGIQQTIANFEADSSRKAIALEKLYGEYNKVLEELRKEREGGQLEPPGKPLSPKLNKALEDFATKNPDMVEFNSEIGMLKFKSDFTFGLGSATPKATAVAAITKLVEVLQTPDADKFGVYVAGHTDDVPIRRTIKMHPNNWYLSVHRAVGVANALETAGLDSSRICAMGFGEWHPVAPNKPGKKGNALNRRVEIWIVPRGAFLQTGVQEVASEVTEGLVIE
ncbi:MAG: OmpA family protein [Phycisphaerales bacterium]|nr:OmpA family protein [Phycisphaerales bacterium]MBT7171331.1 OmpA family protein [Phycisphaerales bacterium]